MTDTHSHIYLDDFDNDRDEAVNRARKVGIRHLIMPNVDLSTIDPLIATHTRYAGYTSMAMGLHPTSVDGDFRDNLAAIRRMFDSHRFVAVGEVGIDLYWDTAFAEQQKEAFDTQLHWAEELSLPVIIHCRDGMQAITDVFRNYSGTLPCCVFHSFGGTREDVDHIRSFGDFYFGINGIVTFKNAKLSDVLPTIGIERILLETDCPYLTPVPFRGKRNESSYIPYIAAKIAESLNLSVREVSQATDLNAATLFPLTADNEI